MSGRGGRGGRGFGRGRGGGGAPEIKDDDGQYITHTVAGPPPLYPVSISHFGPPTLVHSIAKQWRPQGIDSVKFLDPPHS